MLMGPKSATALMAVSPTKLLAKRPETTPFTAEIAASRIWTGSSRKSSFVTIRPFEALETVS